MNKHVFVSYSSKETQVATAIRDRLEQNGISCWMAPDSIAPGASYMSEIPKGIKNCQIFILLLSECAQNSPWVIKELETAISAGKKIIPFIISDCVILEEFAFMLSNVQYWNAYTSMEEQLLKLVEYCQELLGIKPCVSLEAQVARQNAELLISAIEQEKAEREISDPKAQKLKEDAAALDGKGKKLRDLGRSLEAVFYFEKALNCKEELYGDNADTDGLWDLFISYSNIGDVLEVAGKHNEALEYFEKALASMERLYELKPSLKHLRDLSVSCRSVGNSLFKMGNYAEALIYYEKQVVYAKEAHEKGPGSKGFKKLSLGYDDMGKTYHAMGQSAKALVCYQKALKNAEELMALNPEMVNKKILAGAYANVGEVYSELEEYDEALTVCEKAVEIMQEVYKDKPSDFRGEDLWRAYMILANVYLACERVEDSRLSYETALEISRVLFVKDDSLANARKYILSLKQLSICLKKQNKLQEAKGYQETAIAEAELLCRRSDEEIDAVLFKELKAMD